MGTPSYMRSIVGRKVVMPHMTIYISVFSLPLRCTWGLRSSALLRSVEW